MSDAAHSNDHDLSFTRGRPPGHRRQPRKGVVAAALLGVIGFVALLLYSTVGAGGAGAQTGEKVITAKALIDHECDDTEWHFVINQIDTEAHAPTPIHVTWANGASEDVPLAKFTGGVAHYTTTSNLDSVVTSATATIYSGWSGQFDLSHGPCGRPTTSPPPSTTSPPPSTTSPPPSTTSPPPSTKSY